ncbi:hypothetical protein POF50_028260 [Streptomyces sp. SL13]|uniref:Uncharacterized protein n=1 Tax=Streptantibioticus silvisoli TaxID=2705255 RepID=A0AA90H9B4_9ACTN|nr:hypothetical protein [Streptantibioticus silvisoli]MDI5973193.1 hypothetical protein [Streptantibioticus silvisoli]
MPADSRDMPPVRLLPDADLARLALAAPLFDRAVRLARWAAPQVAVDAAAELVEAELLRAAAELGIADDPDGLPETTEAWAFAVDTGLVDVELADAGPADDPHVPGADPGTPAGTAVPGGTLEVVGAGDPAAVLGLWRTGFESALAEAASAGLADLFGDADPDGEPDRDADEPAWNPGEEAAFLDGALANLYLLTALEESAARRSTAPAGPVPAAAGSPLPGTAPGAQAVPLPVLAASMVVPDDMDVPTDAVLEEVSEAMMRLDDHFRLLADTGLVDYQPVDDALIEEDTADEEEPAVPDELDEEEVSRYGMVRLTPLGVLGVRERLRAAGVTAPVVGDLAGEDAATLLAALVSYPEDAAFDEAERWLADREPRVAAGELLAAARGTGTGAPARRLACQQTLSRLDIRAEPALREVLGDRELGGLARVWLVERGASDVPAPDESMVFWLTVDTLAAQLDVDDDAELLADLVRDLVARHDGFFDAAWRVDHPDTAAVLEAVGRLHPDRSVAKEARKAAFKARSAG